MTMIILTKEMFSTGKPMAQGEVLIWMKEFAPQSVLDRVAKLKNLVDMPLINGSMVLGHSETGAHHVLEPVNKKVPISKAAQALIDTANDSLIELKLSEPCEIIHLRGFDTHKTFVLPAGEYARGIREEQTVRGWTRVSD